MSLRPLRIAMLGAAHVGHAISYGRHVAAAEAVELVGLHDADAGVATAVAEKLGGAKVFGSPQALVAQPGLDAVVVVGATDQHRAAVEAAAAAGVHVLCEKPIATTTADARAMIDACASAAVQLQVAFVCRFYPMVQLARKMVEEQEIGPVVGMVGGNRGRPPLPPAYPAWITDATRAGGGALLDHSVHVIDAMRYLSGAEVVSVRAETGTMFNEELAVEDAALLLLEFDDGAVASIDPSWSVPEASPYHYDFYLRVLGASGTLDLDDRRQALRLASDVVERRGARLEPFGADVDGRMIDTFLRSVRQGERLAPAASGEDGLRAVEVALAAYEAARTGDTVRIVGRCDGQRRGSVAVREDARTSPDAGTAADASTQTSPQVSPHALPGTRSDEESGEA